VNEPNPLDRLPIQNRKGERISLEQFCDYLQDPKRTIGKTQVGKAEVSTVHLGLPHPCWRADCDEIMCSYFETMVFGGKHDQLLRRYHTMKEAVDGHAEIVQMLELEVSLEAPAHEPPDDA